MESVTVGTGIEPRIAVAVGVIMETENELFADTIGVAVPLVEDLTKVPPWWSQWARGEGTAEVGILGRNRRYSDELG